MLPPERDGFDELHRSHLWLALVLIHNDAASLRTTRSSLAQGGPA